MTALVLVADDDPFNLRLLCELCEGAGYRVATAADGGAVLEAVARQRPDLILLDVSMPVLDGFEVLSRLKSDSTLAGIPVVMVTASGDDESRSRAVELGAEDYVTKPYRVFEIQQRLRTALRVQAAENEAARARERIQSAELVDSLTRAGTSQQLLVSLDYEFARAARYRHPLTCVVVRVVNYANLVQAGGQERGEGALVQITSGLRTCVRSIDHIFRSDLEEFALLLPETGPDGAEVVRERIEQRANDSTLWGAAVQPLPRLCVGLATYPESEVDDGNALLRAALASMR